MKDEQAGVATSDHTIRMTDSICVALDKPSIKEITATVLSDSHDILIEMWTDNGRVVGQYIARGTLATRLKKNSVK